MVKITLRAQTCKGQVNLYYLMEETKWTGALEDFDNDNGNGSKSSVDKIWTKNEISFMFNLDSSISALSFKYIPMHFSALLVSETPLKGCLLFFAVMATYPFSAVCVCVYCVCGHLSLQQYSLVRRYASFVRGPQPHHHHHPTYDNENGKDPFSSKDFLIPVWAIRIQPTTMYTKQYKTLIKSFTTVKTTRSKNDRTVYDIKAFSIHIPTFDQMDKQIINSYKSWHFKQEALLSWGVI